MVRSCVLVLAACSSSKPRAADDAPRVPRSGDAPAIDAIAIDAAPPSNENTGDLQIRVEWKDVPIPMRASPGRTACRTPRTPAVAPTTTWGIPDVLVIVEGVIFTHPQPRILLADCTFTPRIALGAAILESGVDRPAKVTLAKRGTVATIARLEPGTPTPIQLPIIGHAIALPAEADGVYELAFESETAWVVASASARVTEPNGQVLAKDLAPGKYTVTAWLPPRSGAPAKIAKGTATVVAGDLEDLTLQLE